MKTATRKTKSKARIISVSLMLVMFVGLTLTSCNQEDVQANNGEVLELPAFLQGVGIDEVELIEIKIEYSEDVLYRTEDFYQINDVINLCSDWDLESNIVPEDEIMDLSTPLLLTFNNDLEISTYPGLWGSNTLTPKAKYYGTVDGKAVYLPEGVCEFIRAEALESLID